MSNPALEQAIIDRISEKGVSLPVLPDVAVRVRKVINNPDSSAADLVAIVSQEPAIAARLIQVANSAMYRGASPIDNLNHVVSRLGQRAVGQLVVSLATRDLFKSRDKDVQAVMRLHWGTAAQVAALSHHIAKHHSRLDADQALLVGLLHGVGGLPVISVAEDIPRLKANRQLLLRLIERLQPRLGARIVKAWDFPPVFAQVIENTNNMEYDHHGSADDVDVVLCAIAQARGIATLEDGSPIPAAQKLQLDLSVDLIDDELEQAIDALAGN